jgi:pyruvate,water dikinase
MFTVKLSEVDKNNKNVGGKAANLGEMIKINIPVPPGFVVTTNAFDTFIKENKLEEKIDTLLEGLNVDDQKELKNVSSQIQNLILNAEMPEKMQNEIIDEYEELSVGKEVKKLGGYPLELIKAGREVLVAVRSSATAEDLETASFAGQMRTFLNIKGKRQLLLSIKKCWASLYTPRAIFYRKHHRIGKTSIGVIVQKMIDAEKSGVTFTADPLTNDKTKVVIEASFGLGESIVSGLVIPDRYIVDKETGNIIEVKVSKKLWIKKLDKSTGETVKTRMPSEMVEKRVLGDSEIKKLFEFAIKLEQHYNRPQDIEWCEERGRLYIVQTRAITTLGKVIEKREEDTSKRYIISGLPASPGLAKGKVKVVLSLDHLDELENGDILVTKMTNPDMVPYMKKASAIITDEGGITSHAAIVSRELGIPCVVGTGNATSVLQNGQIITVDATNGKIYPEDVEIKEETHLPGIEELQQPEQQVLGATPTIKSEEPLQEAKPIVSESDHDIGSTRVKVKVNIAFPETVERVKDKADGVGLLRAEHMLTESGKHPVFLAKNNPEQLIETIVNNVGKIAEAFYPRPVWYRTLDARTDEFRSLEGGENEPSEKNPMLGWHGIRRSLEEPDVFKCEIEAIRRLHAKGLKNVCIMLPFVCDINELRKAKQFIDFDVKIGIMVETPAAAMQIEEFCKDGIAFASIGTNDLTQLALGVDRGNAQIAKLYSEFNPGVLKLIKATIDGCKKYNVESSICGESASNPEMAKLLVELGIDSLSVEMDAIETIRKVVATTEMQIFLEGLKTRK